MRRRAKRRHLIYYLDVYEATTGRLVGHVGDLTREGLLLLELEQLDLGATLDLEVAMPDVPGLSGRIRARATVRWLGEDRNPSIACAGCSFEPLSLEDETALDLLVRLVGFEDSDV